MKFKTSIELLKALLDNGNVLWSAEGKQLSAHSNGIYIYFDIDGSNHNEIYCTAIEWFAAEPLQDKDHIEFWDNEDKFSRSSGFYDKINQRAFGDDGQRDGATWENYRKITPIPEWAIEAKKLLQD